MASRRLQKRIEAEAAEKLGKAEKKPAAKTKRATRKTTTTTRKRKTKAVERKKIFWGVFSGTLKEEGRFAYDQRDKAEEKLEALRNRSTKKLYFIQPIKASLSDSVSPTGDEDLDDLENDDEIIEVAEDDGEMADDIDVDMDLDDDDDDFGDDSEEESESEVEDD